MTLCLCEAQLPLSKTDTVVEELFVLTAIIFNPDDDAVAPAAKMTRDTATKLRLHRLQFESVSSESSLASIY